MTQKPSNMCAAGRLGSAGKFGRLAERSKYGARALYQITENANRAVERTR